MTTRKPLAFLHRSLTALGAILAFVVGSSSANAQFLPIWFGHGVVLEASDIHEEGVAAQTLCVTHFDQIDPSTLGDDDIWVVSPDGFNAFAKFEGYEEVAPGDVLADPAQLDQLVFSPEGDPFQPWVFGAAIAAKYSLAAPDGSAWKPADNGSYSVLVAENSVAVRGGGFVEHQLLGTFGVRVGDPPPVQVEDWKVNVVDSANGCRANVRLKFALPAVVAWGEVMRDGERLFVRIEATSSPNGSRTGSHSYGLGDFAARQVFIRGPGERSAAGHDAFYETRYASEGAR